MEKIKNYWRVFNTEHKKKATEKVMEEFELKSKDHFLNRWIWGEKIPQEKQARVEEIFGSLYKEQEKETKKLLSRWNS